MVQRAQWLDLVPQAKKKVKSRDYQCAWEARVPTIGQMLGKGVWVRPLHAMCEHIHSHFLRLPTGIEVEEPGQPGQQEAFEDLKQ